jgi:hypothetical protein
MSYRGDREQRISFGINGHGANGRWSYNQADGLVLEGAWGPGPKQQARIVIKDHDLLELHYAILRAVADQLDEYRAIDREAHYLNQLNGVTE